MKNRKLLLIVSLVLALTMSLGGTMAYLTDTDADVNTMVLGNVKIEQNEWQRQVDENGEYVKGTVDNRDSYVLEPFEQDKMLLPIVGDPNEPGDSPAYKGPDGTEVRMSQVGSYGGMYVFAGKNAQDKFVTVKNTGNTPAYVRTYIAFEVGSTENKNAEGKDLIMFSALGDSDGFEAGTDAPWDGTAIGFVTINGNNYMVMEYVYAGAQLGDGSFRHKDGVLPAKDTTYPSLCQVYLKHYANNEDLINLDGNKNGTLDILVLSQAVQADGFEATTEKSAAQVALEAGFGEVTAANVKGWFEGKDFEDSNLPVVGEASNAQDITDAITAGADTVKLAAGEYKLPGSVGGKELTFVGDEDTVIDLSAAQGVSGADLTFKGVTVKTTSQNNTGIQHSGDIKYENVTFNGSTFLYGDSVVFENCTFNLTSNYIWTYGAAEVTFNNCTFNTDGKAILVYKEAGAFSQTVNVHNCTFNATKSGFASAVPGQPCAAVEIDSSLINGAYTLHFTGTNMVDSDFSGLVRIKAGADKNNVTITGATAVALPVAE